jgi:hypothetical protein
LQLAPLQCHLQAQVQLFEPGYAPCHNAHQQSGWLALSI